MQIQTLTSIDYMLLKRLQGSSFPSKKYITSSQHCKCYSDLQKVAFVSDELWNQNKLFFEWLGKKSEYKIKQGEYQFNDLRGEETLPQEKSLKLLHPQHESISTRYQTSKSFWKVHQNQKYFFEWLGTQLGYQQMEDWYSLTLEELIQFGGKHILEHYHDLSDALTHIYPTHVFHPWQFKQNVAPGYWEDKTHCLKFFDWLGDQLSFTKKEDWYQISMEQIANYGGRGVFAHFNNSPLQALQTVYPEYDWVPWKFKQPPKGLWTDFENHKKFFDWLGKLLGFNEMEDWYQIRTEQIIQNEGYGLLSEYYHLSPALALQRVYPEYPWQLWKFHVTPKGFWDQKTNQKKYFDWLGKQLGVETMEDWYSVDIQQVALHSGSGLISHYYNNSFYNALKSVYPEHEWLPWKFQRVGRKIWTDKTNHTQFFGWLHKQLEKASS